MDINDLSESLIAPHIDAKVFARGVSYFKKRAVEDVVLRGDVITASVEGSEGDPYQVRIKLGEQDIAEASCTCPYDAEWGGWCKHIAATLLLSVYRPKEVRIAPPLARLLAAMDRNALEALLIRLADAEPLLTELIAAEAEYEYNSRQKSGR